MTTFPKSLQSKLASTIKTATTTLALHTQQITTLQSVTNQTTTQLPGPWSLITLQGGWSNVSGAIAAQWRGASTTTTEIIGNIRGGTTSDGTVIGYIPSGFFNTVYVHWIGAVAVAGASSVTISGSVTDGFVSEGELINGTSSVSGSTATLNDLYLHATQALNNTATTSTVNYNRPCIKVGTDGSLTLYNVNSHVTQLSFHDPSLPLFTQ